MLCSRNCGREATATHPWCRECQAAYQRAMRPVRAKLKANADFSRGVEAMRNAIVEHFHGVGLESFNGHAAAEFARKVTIEG